MPYIDVDIDVDDFLNACSRRDISNLIKALVEDEHLPESVLREVTSANKPVLTQSEIDFSDKLDLLKTKFYSLTQEEEETLNGIFKRIL